MLKEGVGVIAGDVTFSDNSSWTRSRKFRLGARLTGDGGAVEARSEAFGCKDHRGESYKKHHPPYPGDEVWRLEKIAGVSATRLRERGITTVKDFRRWNATNPTALYNILREGISKKTWEGIVSHAMRCVLDETECYIYNAKANGECLLLNSVYEVIKVSFSGIYGPFRNADDRTIDETFLDQLKREAYQNINCFVPVNGRIFVDLHPQRSLQLPQNSGFGIARPELHHLNFQGCSDPSSSSMLPFSNPTVQPEMLMSFDNSPAATFHLDEKFLPKTLRNSFKVREYDPVHGESQLQILPTRGYIEDEDENPFVDHHHYHDIPSNWSPGMTHWTKQTLEGLCVSVSGTEEAGTIDVRIANLGGSPRARWCKVKAAFKIREVWRNTTARNRNRGL